MPPLLQTTVARTQWIIVAVLGLILSAERAQAGEIASVVGIWSGQIQVMTTSKGIVEKGSHSVADGRIRIERGGRVSGLLSGNHCELLGLASASSSPGQVDLDVSASGCEYSEQNVRYKGSVTPKARGLVLELTSADQSKGYLRKSEIEGLVFLPFGVGSE